jgi:hypothetical protein
MSVVPGTREVDAGGLWSKASSDKLRQTFSIKQTKSIKDWDYGSSDKVRP